MSITSSAVTLCRRGWSTPKDELAGGLHVCKRTKSHAGECYCLCGSIYTPPVPGPPRPTPHEMQGD